MNSKTLTAAQSFLESQVAPFLFLHFNVPNCTMLLIPALVCSKLLMLHKYKNKRMDVGHLSECTMTNCNHHPTLAY